MLPCHCEPEGEFCPCHLPARRGGQCLEFRFIARHIRFFSASPEAFPVLFFLALIQQNMDLAWIMPHYLK